MSAPSLYKSWFRPSFPLQLAIVFLVAVTTLLFLRTSDYLAVDGALRALEVYQTDRLFLHANNHLLYPLHVHVWSAALAALGFVAYSPIEFLRLAQAMNALAAAGVLTIFWGVAYRATSSPSVACLTTLGYGMSRAFSAHATNSAEPMVGLFWSAGSVALVASALPKPNYWRLLTGGFLLALAMASYQSMVLIGPGLLALIWSWPAPEPSDRPTAKRVGTTLAFGAGCVTGVAIIYGIAYYWSGTQEVASMIERFRHLTSANVYGGVTLIKMATLFPGLAYAVFPCLPRECGGFGCLAEPRHQSWIAVSVLAVFTVCACVILIALTVKRCWPQTAGIAKSILVCCAVALVCTSVPLVYWMPTYDKFWLQPLACLFLMSGVVIRMLSFPPAQALGEPRYRKRFLWGAAGAVAIVVVCNATRVVESHLGPTPYLAEANRVASLLGPRDLLVGDWNDIFIFYQRLLANGRSSFNLRTEADRSGTATLRLLAEAIRTTETSGGAVFFLGPLDESRAQWNAVLARRGLRYEDLELYRCCTEPILHLGFHGSYITLRRLGTSATGLAS